jgi:hypothetical protein
MSFVKNTAVTGFNFLLIKATDGTALTAATVTCKVSKDGGAQATSVHSATELAGGEYTINFDADEFNATTVGLLFTATGAIPVHFTIKPVVLNVDVANVAADLQTIKTKAITCAADVTVLASVGTAATSAAQTGDSFARLGAPANASIAADLAEIEAETDAVGSPQQSGSPVTLPANPPANFIDAASIAAGALNGKGDWLPSSAMTESYAADGDAPTPAQALFFIQQLLSDFIISGSTLTVRKLDGSTTAFTLTLNDATNPTGATRGT